MNPLLLDTLNYYTLRSLFLFFFLAGLSDHWQNIRGRGMEGMYRKAFYMLLHISFVKVRCGGAVFMHMYVYACVCMSHRYELGITEGSVMK